MNTSENDRCRCCGAKIRSESTEKLCPACLMSGALNSPGAGDQTLSMGPAELLSHCGPSEFPYDFGGYRLLGLLGRGGMGAVYEAEQLATGRLVALKMLGQQLDSPEMRKRFLREGRLAAGVNHPNSLYVFGSEEIEGLPVITMEIAGSGTLSDKLKKRGPLPVTEAVDAILDVIAGLEAAFAGGVLHRDIKPSNCFVSPDGSVKVGDFGLSVSTVPTAQTFATVTGKIMGTPAYAPPEQLRGRELDVRADIYSVGATLFTLLTDKPPIEGKNPVEIVAAALDEKPKSLTEFRKDIPPRLAKVVARCLAKKPEQRYSDYSTLRNALLPFSSAQAEPAPLGRRLLAGFIDTVVISLGPVALLSVLLGIDVVPPLVMEHAATQLGAFIGLQVLVLSYYTIWEGIWGAGLGKALLGFQVVRPDGRGPGLARAFLRTALDTLLGNVGKIVGFTAFTAENYERLGLGLTFALDCLGVLAFVTMRRRNGFATVWDLVTGTRVVVKPRGAERPVVEIETVPAAPAGEAPMIGPYPVVEEIVPGDWVAAHDPILRRAVWLRRRAESEIAPARRDLARPGRTRWLHQVETPEANWDVFESQAGVSLRSLFDEEGHLPWESMRHWLHDLASEIALAAHDETLPAGLSLDHVWISARGRAVLLDKPWPKTAEPAECIPVGDLAGQQRFLHAIATSVSPKTVPLHARSVLQSLAGGSFEKLSFLAGSLRSLLTKRAKLNRQFRAASLLAVPLIVVAVLLALSLGAIVRGIDLGTPNIDIWEATKRNQNVRIRQHAVRGTDLNAREPESGGTPLTLAAARGHNAALWVLLDNGADINLRNRHGWTALHVAAFYGRPETTRILLAQGADPDLTTNDGKTPLDMVSEPWNAELEGAYKTMAGKLGGTLNLKRIKSARPKITQLIQDPASTSPVDAPPGTNVEAWIALGTLIVISVFVASMLAFIQLISLLAARATLGQFVFGFAVVNAAGAPAGRARLLARWLVAWAMPVLCLLWFIWTLAGSRDWSSYYLPCLALGIWCVGLAAAIIRPTRGLHDQLTGCWLVPR